MTVLGIIKMYHHDDDDDDGDMNRHFKKTKMNQTDNRKKR